MTFAQPIWLAIGAAACAALFLLLVRAQHKRRAAVRRLAAASPNVSLALHRRLVRDGLALLGTALAFIALARPQGGMRLEPAPSRGVDLMFAVDTSKSMRATDLRPDRLTRAKLAVADLARSFDGARLGLIAFAGNAFVQAPMTADRTVFLESLDALDTDTIPQPGTDVSSAIRAAEQAMASEPDHHKALVLLSDGEDLAGSARDAARDAAAHGLTIYTVGVGSEAGSLIEVPDEHGTPALVRDASGAPVTSHLDEPTLRAVAQLTGGAYAPLGPDGRGLATLYASARAQLPTTSATGATRRVFAERFQIPLAGAIAALLAGLLIGERRRSGGRRRSMPAALATALLVVPQLATASPTGDYNDGTSAYRAGDFARAEKAFDAALHSSDVALQANAYYDLGNARYRAGQATLAKQDKDATIATWKQAIAAYDAALAIAADDADAKFNRDFVAKKLAALEEQKKADEQKKDQQQQQQSKDQQQQSKQQQGNGQQQQSKNEQGNGKQQQQQSDNNQGNGTSGQQQSDNQQGNGKSGQQSRSGSRPDGSRPDGSSHPADTVQRDDHAGSGSGEQPDPSRPDNARPDNSRPDNSRSDNPRPDPARPDASSPPPDAADAADRADHAGSGAPTVGVASGAQQPPRPDQAAASAAAAAAAAQARADAARRAAGQLTRGEAVQLLDAVAHDLRPMPIRGDRRPAPTTPTTKDW